MLRLTPSVICRVVLKSTLFIQPRRHNSPLVQLLHSAATKLHFAFLCGIRSKSKDYTHKRMRRRLTFVYFNELALNLLEHVHLSMCGVFIYELKYCFAYVCVVIVAFCQATSLWQLPLHGSCVVQLLPMSVIFLSLLLCVGRHQKFDIRVGHLSYVVSNVLS